MSPYSPHQDQAMHKVVAFKFLQMSLEDLAIDYALDRKMTRSRWPYFFKI